MQDDIKLILTKLSEIESKMATKEELEVVRKEMAKKTDLKKLSDDVEMLAAATAKGFASVDKRFDIVDQKFKEVDKKLSDMNHKIEDVEENLSEQIDGLARATNTALGGKASIYAGR